MADLCVVLVAWGIAYGLRFHTALLPGHPVAPDPRTYLLLGLGMLPVWHLLLRARGLYEPRRGAARWKETRLLVEGASIASLCLASAPFFVGGLEVSRLVVALFWLLASAGLVAFRATLREALAQIRSRGYNRRRVAIIGTGILAGEVYGRIEAQPETGFEVVGFVGPSRGATPAGWPSVIGGFQNINGVVEEHGIDHVLLAVDRADPVDWIKLARELQNTTAAVRIVPDLRGFPSVQGGIEELDDLPVIRLVESPLLGWSRVQKRALDVVVSSAGLAVLSPLLAAVALAIRWTSPDGPVLFRQRRMGLDGRLFWILKFRTMIPDAETATGPKWAEPNDPRRTPLGACLRRWNLDELPQLWNVLRGEMSLVGPRPERPEFIREFRKQLPGYMLRHKVKAGITGWAQVNGWRGQTSIEKRLEHDMEYVQRWSLWLDIKILVRTLFRGFGDRNAY
jgi:Undecaprenyl-phosphate glucose phosphotransferase